MSTPPTVIAFQEVTAKVFSAYLAVHLEKAGYSCVSKPNENRSYFEVLAVHESWKVQHSEKMLFSRSMYGRELHWADITRDGQEVRVSTGHLDSGKGNGKSRQSALKEITSTLKDYQYGVFAGDANIRKSEWESWRDNSELTDAWEAGGEDPDTRDTWFCDEMRARFDRIWSTKAMQVVEFSTIGDYFVPETPQMRPSDHLGVKATYQL